MKATLEFNLPEDTEEHLRAIKSSDLCNLVWDWEAYLRGLYHHQDLSTMTAEDLIEEVYGEHGKWWQMKEDNGINFNEIWT